MTHVLYLHGFRSSPQSGKARFVAERLAADHPDLIWRCPQLPPSPREAVALARRELAGWPMARSAVIGSSLGGYYATALAEATGCRAVLLNPAVDPARDLAGQTGELKAWHDDARFFFRAEFIGELRDLAAPRPLAHPERFLAIIATGDEVLSWREMSGRYPGSPQRIVDGSDHALSDFATHWPAVETFLGLRAEAADPLNGSR